MWTLLEEVPLVFLFKYRLELVSTLSSEQQLYLTWAMYYNINKHIFIITVIFNQILVSVEPTLDITDKSKNIIILL